MMNNEETSRIRVLEILNGIGISRKAFSNLNVNYEIVEHIESNPVVLNTYNAIYGTEFEPQEILKWNKEIKADIIIHSTPCTTIKVEEWNDWTNSVYIYQVFRIINNIKSKYIIWDFSRTKISDQFEDNVEKYIEVLEKLGYRSYWKIYVGKDCPSKEIEQGVLVISVLNENIVKLPIKSIIENACSKYIANTSTTKLNELNEKINKRNSVIYAQEIDNDMLYNYNMHINDKNKKKISDSKKIWKEIGFNDEEYARALIVNNKQIIGEQVSKCTQIALIEQILYNIFVNINNEYNIICVDDLVINVEKGLIMEKNLTELGDAIAKFEIDGDKYELIIEKYCEFKDRISKSKYLNGYVNNSVIKLLDIIILKCLNSESSGNNIEIKFDEIFNLMGKSDKYDLKERVKLDLEILSKTKFKGIDKKENGIEKYIINGFEFDTSIKVNICEELYEHIVNGNDYMYYKTEKLKISEKRNPHFYQIYKYVLYKKVNNGNRISIREIYEYCHSIQRIEQVKEKGRQYGQLIMKPIKTALAALGDIYEIKYEYMGNDFKEWINSYVVITEKNTTKQ